MDINSNEPKFCPYITELNKYIGSFKNINDP